MTYKITLLGIVMCSLLGSSCTTNWATVNKPISFMPDLITTLQSAEKLPVQLTGEQASELLASLSGPVRKQFTSNKLQSEIYASWWELDFPHPNSVTFVRFPKTGEEYYAYISHTPDGRLFSAGSGRVESAPPP